MKFSFLICDAITNLAELARRIEYLASLGYDAVEIQPAYPLGYGLEEVADLSRKHRLPIVSLLSGWSYAHDGLCLSSPDAGIRNRAVGRLIENVEFAARLQSIVVIGLMQGLRKDEPDETRANERIKDCLGQAAAVAADRKVTLVIEPVNHLQVGFNHTAAAVAALVEQVASPALSYMLDTIHMNIEERSILKTIQTHGPRIRHFHLCETNGGPFGSGNLDFDKVLTALKNTGYAHYVSIKIYQNSTWDEAARSASDFLKPYRAG